MMLKLVRDKNPKKLLKFLKKYNICLHNFLRLKSKQGDVHIIKIVIQKSLTYNKFHHHIFFHHTKLN